MHGSDNTTKNMELTAKDRMAILNTRFIHRQLHNFDRNADKTSTEYAEARIALLIELAKNYPGARVELGVYYLEKGDYAHAFKWFRDSTGDGSGRSLHDVQPRACIYLGDCYKNGWGVEKDDMKASKWYLVGVKVWRLYEKFI